jgi:hypothetical protein
MLLELFHSKNDRQLHLLFIFTRKITYTPLNHTNMKTKSNWKILRHSLFRFAILLFMLPGCSQPEEAVITQEDPYNGVRSRYRNDGTLLSTVTYMDSIRHGIARNYYRDGSVKLEMNYANGVKHGDAITYYESGDIYQVTQFVNGKREGIQKRYYPGNKLMAEIPFSNNKQVPGLKEYSEDGRLLTKDDRIVFRLVDKTAIENMFELHITMSDNSPHTRFYREIRYEDSDLNLTIDLLTEKGKTMLEFYVGRGQSYEERVFIIGKRQTRLGNIEIFEAQYNVAVKNTHPRET